MALPSSTLATIGAVSAKTSSWVDAGPKMVSKVKRLVFWAPDRPPPFAVPPVLQSNSHYIASLLVTEEG